jgi:hypothetical protein
MTGERDFEWGYWATRVLSRDGELPAWLQAAPNVAAAVEAFDGEDETITDVWFHVADAIRDGLVTAPTEWPPVVDW